jgi:hypothetical protein
VITPEWTTKQVRTFLKKQHDKITEAVTTIYEIARPADDNYYKEIAERYPTVRRFLPSVLRTIEWKSNEAGKPILEAVAFLKDLEGRKKPDLSAAPLAVVPTSWKRYVAPTGQPIDRRYYTLCVMARLQEAVHRHDVFVEQSARWGDPRAKLLTGKAETTSSMTARRWAIQADQPPCQSPVRFLHS